MLQTRPAIANRQAKKGGDRYVKIFKLPAHLPLMKAYLPGTKYHRFKNGWHPVEVAAKRPRVQWGTPLPQCNHHLTNSEEIRLVGEND